VILSLFQNCPPLFSVLLRTSSVPHTHIFFDLSQLHQRLHLRLPYTSTAFWIKNSKLAARIQFLHSKELSQPPKSSNFYHIHYV
jgi:hypothetical protein